MVEMPHMPRMRSRLKPFVGRADMTPWVDVLFLLVIFFMLTSSFVQVSGIAVELPRTPTASRVGLEKFIITIAMSSDGRPLIYFRDRLVSEDALKEELSQISARSVQGMVIIRADQQVPHGEVSRVMALAAEFGLSSFLATLPPEPAQTVNFGQ